MSIYCKTCKHYKNKGLECAICTQAKVNGEELDTPSNYVEFDPERHVKGYIYDSLVYRYKFALEQATDARAESMFCGGTGQYTSKQEAIAAARNLNERDLIRFLEILNEAIGEHY